MAACEFAWKLPGLYNVPAQKVGMMLDELSRNASGLTPQSLIDANRAEGTLLHDVFEWRDDVAADKYRQEQARAIIRNIVIVEQTTDEEERAPVRGYVSAPGGESRYVTMQSALTEEKFRAKLLEDAKRDAKLFTAKYRRLNELASVTDAMERFLHDVG